jgi:hypothetical protein
MTVMMIFTLDNKKCTISFTYIYMQKKTTLSPTDIVPTLSGPNYYEPLQEEGHGNQPLCWGSQKKGTQERIGLQYLTHCPLLVLS